MILWLGAAALFLVVMTFLVGHLVVGKEPDFDEAISDILEKSDERVQVVLAESRDALSREDILLRMSAIYRETVLLVVGLGGFTAHVSLVLFNVLFTLLWLKSWVLPNAADLRLLLGGEMFILCQLKQDVE